MHHTVNPTEANVIYELAKGLRMAAAPLSNPSHHSLLLPPPGVTLEIILERNQ